MNFSKDEYAVIVEALKFYRHQLIQDKILSGHDKEWMSDLIIKAMTMRGD